MKTSCKQNLHGTVRLSFRSCSSRLAEGGSVSKLTDEMAADGYDLQADWEAMEVKNTTTGAGRKGGSRAAVADQLLQPPSSPKV